MEKKVTAIRMNGVNEQEVDTEARYSLEEELQIIKSIQQRGKERDTAIEKLAQSRLRFVTAVAKKYVNNNLSMTGSDEWFCQLYICNTSILNVLFLLL